MCQLIIHNVLVPMDTNMLKPVYILERFELHFLKLLVLIERGVFSREESNTVRMVLLLS